MDTSPLWLSFSVLYVVPPFKVRAFMSIVGRYLVASGVHMRRNLITVYDDAPCVETCGVLPISRSGYPTT